MRLQGPRWQNWLKDIDQVTEPQASFIKDGSQLRDLGLYRFPNWIQTRSPLKSPVFDDADWPFAKGIQERYQPDVLFLSAGNPEPKATGILSKTN